MAISVLSRTISRRRALATAAGAAGAVAIGSVASVSAAAGPDGRAAGEFVSGGQMVEGIVVTGNGQASAEVSSAIVQYLIRYAADAPQLTDASMSTDTGYYGGSYPAPDADSMAHVVEALVDAGIPSAQVKTFPGSDSMYGAFGSGVSVVAASIDDAALLATLGDILEAGADAAKETKLQIDSIGAIYATDDCESVNDEALAAAVADANAQGAALANANGVELGDLVGATSSPSYSPYSGYGGAGGACQEAPTLEAAGITYFPSYMAGSEPEFTITASVTLTFALAASE
ncbi:MAG: SIMPL domain-containing protein [Thermomicrobiales bacterium]